MSTIQENAAARVEESADADQRKFYTFNAGDEIRFLPHDPQEHYARKHYFQSGAAVTPCESACPFCDIAFSNAVAAIFSRLQLRSRVSLPLLHPLNYGAN